MSFPGRWVRAEVTSASKATDPVFAPGRGISVAKDLGWAGGWEKRSAPVLEVVRQSGFSENHKSKTAKQLL